jgi:hypothetical protein
MSDATPHRVERCEDCAAVLGQHEPCSYTDCPHAIPNSVRDEAVRIVDTRHGYTAEHAPDPESHRAEYDAEEAAHATRNRVHESLLRVQQQLGHLEGLIDSWQGDCYCDEADTLRARGREDMACEWCEAGTRVEFALAEVEKALRE